MNWIIWALLLVPLGVPVGSLTVDRIMGISARKQWLFLGFPALAAFAGALAYGVAVDDPIVQLVAWGALAGVLGTAALDVVRLIGVQFKAFPLDMPEMFGMIALRLAPILQRNMMREMVAHTAALPDDQRRVMLESRLKALAVMSAPRREAVMKGMMAGLADLPEERRQTMLRTQMAILSELPGEQRRALMAAMDSAMAVAGNGTGQLPYSQPRGMPRISMATFRQLAERAMPRTRQEAGVSLARVRAAGYFWHFVMGSTFGISYTLLFGQGSWGLAIAWGVFVWLAMMVLMPPMMPMVRFPRWFPIIPFIAHIAMVVPFALVGLYLVSGPAHLHSFLGAFG